MFGYVVADQANLTPEELERYRGVYCGLCRRLGQRHGQHARMILTYDMTFLILLLGSLYEPEEQAGKNRCAPHPVRPRPWTVSSITDYAADMNVALAYYNSLDDWQDDKNVAKLAAAKSLERAYDRIRRDWPRQCQTIERELKTLSALEKESSPSLDQTCQSFGRLMAELFVLKEDHWSPTLRAMGDRLGQFIYLMDAVMDQKEDETRGHYNPILAFRQQYGPFDPMQTLTMLIGECTLAFERLPLEQDLGLLRNILYSGVWVQYAVSKQKQKQKPKTPPKEEHPT